MKYEAFYLGTITVEGEIMHLLSEKENNINCDVSYAITDDEFEKHCTFIEPTQR